MTETTTTSTGESAKGLSPDGKAEVGVIGMAVMGSSLARNMARHGYAVAIYNRTLAKTEEVVREYGHEGTFVAAQTLEEFVSSLASPRRIVIMVQAGRGTDAVIDELMPLLDKDDIVVDGGNAFFEDTRRREKKLANAGFRFIGAGISGGEVGALEGPSIMPGGPASSYALMGPILEDISAKVDGQPCCTYIGADGAGHFVKMVHNGIEYADMQFIGEAYELLKALGLSADEMADTFASWNCGDLDSYLVEITSEVLRHKDPKTGTPLVDLIVDAAGMKGTGTWTVQSALNLGTPVNSISEAVFARAISSHGELREHAQAALEGPDRTLPADLDREAFINDIRDALWSAKVIAYAQGLDEIRTAAHEYGWQIDVAAVASIWRAGCIIRAALLQRISDEYAANNLTTLLEAPSIAAGLAKNQDAWRRVVATAASAGVPIPGFSSALAYYDQVRSPRLNAALTQGLRDYFGAHTYRRIDGGEASFHTLWSGDRSEINTSTSH
ncbi:NADP-dependent phosphogluconate dehydrogenase [Dermatophilus congolensis]|uniref:NADP-dependent phosphogluconate dehydrogenase n=1 Tax=Dermatophilus congolensis TaxID=1863 RepID=UPI001AAFB60D|nr:NADP-dependent phosphogluconate dehydrogenase [Dermatophilus congolensis]MBO3143485.1 NADP-dependent phosphogluconate dehydrogenase [Dermatophilus congolensis]MBO3152475.1 NADP-dependent phosphogluconate dehydrogenase [Dermatophilus congolensis]MBO3160513.1 NADP-dependent phosphogluconate dehydrogenase [Dermatophilus congolensis]MBO3163762.1 NADP-dependent phosphogluconate dehydrogenase [Dermatophilus congolensis]MBO3177308.1 NADP-dependent phosphogluconate dehydrogenase [Dermatophilus cong